MRIILLLVLLNVAGTLCARDIYVNNLSGDDTLTGRTPTAQGRENGPVQTIAKAMRLAQPGDRVVLAKTAEPYREQVTIQGGKCSGLAEGFPFIFEGSGAVIDGTMSIPDDRWESRGGDLFRYAPILKSHQTLYLDDQPAVRVPLKPGSNELPELKPLQWCLFGGYIYLRVPPGEVPQFHYPACAALQTGITIYDVQNVKVQNVTVRGFALDGLNAHDNGFAVRVEDVVAEQNGRSGYSIGGASRVQISRSLGRGNYGAQLRTEGFSRTTLIDCELDSATAPATEVEGGELLEE